ncbi:PREDICTED: coiled-coil domain-containing protein 47 [Papilio polytes]|uniref:coiled-coil domain-containing protein 47 n=1 Tax=Papilio polytes TaxID=76194 RepID=UPI000675CABA|nr:PREDICTED: coiled-coil domain-containing protein 47 [Papilio polytes]XP_013141016.1 PREDICTED: coiled-coil domain-containing protein 47 [Papilio polytes]
MRLVLLPIVLLACSVVVRGFEDTTLEDDDFAEFEQFDVDDDATVADFSEEEKEVPVQKKPPTKEKFSEQRDVEDDMLVEDEDNEFEHFQDPEEFEGFQDSTPRSSEQPKITISKVPITVRPRWDAYWLEGILCCALAAYAISYVVGRAKNTSIALNFLKLHKPLLEDNFTLVGESEADVSCAAGERGWRREAEHCFTMWCSGRVCCEGMLLTLKLIKRQDLLHVAMDLGRRTPDTLLVRVELGKDDCDPFVLCVAQKKVATRLAKEMQDLSVFCPERRPGEKHGLPGGMSVLSECAEATAGVLDARVCAALAQHHAHLHYIHISDRYCGPKLMEETAMTKPPETERVLLASFALTGDGEELRPLLLLIFYLLDKLKRLRLSKEALAKCEKRRQKVAEAWQRGAHAARQEQAALRREEKRKQEKERILAEDDPEKQRRWELKEEKRQRKRKAPKMKQLKVKAL